MSGLNVHITIFIILNLFTKWALSDQCNTANECDCMYDADQSCRSLPRNFTRCISTKKDCGLCEEITIGSRTGLDCGTFRVCPNMNKIFSNDQVCDGSNDCNDGWDECGCEESRYCQPSSSSSLKGAVCAGGNHVCDGQGSVCPGNTEDINCPGTFLCSDNNWQVVNPKDVCNGVQDCSDYSDEIEPCESTFMCPGRQWISGTSLCDGVNHCGDWLDEVYCETSRGFSCAAQNGTVSWFHQDRLCDGVQDCGDSSDEQYRVCQWIGFNCTETTGQWVTRDKVCDGTPDCQQGEDERSCTDFLWRYSMSFDGGMTIKREEKESVPESLLCNGVGDVHDKLDECSESCGDSTPEFCSHLCGAGWEYNNTNCGCRGYKYGLLTFEVGFNCYESDNRTCISPASLCDGILDCAKGEDERNCSQFFYCDSGRPYHVSRHLVCDGRRNCYDNSDECQQCNLDVLSDDEHIIANPILRGLVWIMGLASLLGNFFVILCAVRTLKTENKITTVALVNKQLIINLASADFLMGVYLISLGTMDEIQKGHYCLEATEWKLSGMCQTLGVLSVLSVQTSVMSLGVLSTYRMLIVIRPHSTDTTRFRAITACTLISLTLWGLSSSLALIPLFPGLHDYFVDEYHYTDNPILLDGTRSAHVSFLQHYHNSSVINSSTSWSELTALVREIWPKAKEWPRPMSYYSKHGVCLPKLFTTTADLNWSYPFFIMLFDFATFLYIMGSYILTYKLSAGRAPARNKKSRANNVLQKKIARLIVVDFCCWVPVCTSAILHFAEVADASAMYPYAAIILLPINSSLNPILYSDMLDVIDSTLKRWFNRQPNLKAAFESLGPMSSGCCNAQPERLRNSDAVVVERGDK